MLIAFILDFSWSLITSNVNAGNARKSLAPAIHHSLWYRKDAASLRGDLAYYE